MQLKTSDDIIALFSFSFLLQRKKSAQFLFVHSLVFPPKENEVRMWVDGEAEKTMEMKEMALSQSEEQLATSPPGSAISRAGWRPWQLITKAPPESNAKFFICVLLHGQADYSLSLQNLLICFSLFR